ncbi:unnamed protein product, partial [marine sediment metagenome]
MAQNYDYSQLTKTQLKEHLRSRGLKLGGNKPELIARLHAHLTGVPDPTATVATTVATVPVT